MTGKEISDKAFEANKIQFEQKGIEWCENCGSTYCLSIAHRRKRRHYKHKDQFIHIQNLTEWSEVVMLCEKCHTEAEQSPALTKEIFDKLRPRNV